ncbi:MAPEG family protein [Alteromonadaceae bacterium BrNp21-10]|nr:MAPEG family protein [Alteromonadaceae bacterium BrNp21-10]
MLYPMFALVLLTVLVAILMGRARFTAVKHKTVNPKYFKTNSGYELTPECAQLERNFSNLFETPVLFYAVCITTLVMGVDSTLLQVLAWIYVALRYAHSYIHITYNHVMHRFGCFISSFLVLLVMWIALVLMV